MNHLSLSLAIVLGSLTIVRVVRSHSHAGWWHSCIDIQIRASDSGGVYTWSPAFQAIFRDTTRQSANTSASWCEYLTLDIRLHLPQMRKHASSFSEITPQHRSSYATHIGQAFRPFSPQATCLMGLRDDKPMPKYRSSLGAS